MFELHPKTKKLLALFAGKPYGTELTYAEILQETECDLLEGERQRIYTVVRRLERDHQRTLLNLRGRGYKVANPNEHVASMRVRTGRARRQVGLARRVGEATPLDKLTDLERRDWSDQMAFNSKVVQAFKYQSAWNAQQDERIAAIEAELAELRAQEAGPVIEGDVVEDSAA